MERTKRIEAKDAALGFLVLYFVLGFTVFALHLAPSDEVYPVYGWTLFRSVPARIAGGVQIRITAVNGSALAHPVNITDALEYVRSVPYGDNNAVLVGFERAYQHADAAQLQRARKSLEKRFVPERVEYETVRQEYDTIEHWKSGAVLTEEVIDTFESGVFK